MCMFWRSEPIQGLVISQIICVLWSYCWWFRNPAPVEVGSFSHYLRFFTSQVAVWDFFHGQYVQTYFEANKNGGWFKVSILFKVFNFDGRPNHLPSWLLEGGMEFNFCWRESSSWWSSNRLTNFVTLLETNIFHLGKRKNILKSALARDMLVLWRVFLLHCWMETYGNRSFWCIRSFNSFQLHQVVTCEIRKISAAQEITSR